MKRWMEQIISVLFWIPPAIIWTTVCVTTHWDMVKGNSRVVRLKRASYLEFKREVDKFVWRYDPDFPNSLFSYDSEEAYFHADIYRFRGTGYLLTPYGYFMSRLLLRKIKRSLISKNPKPYIQ